ncbi:MAG: hypothetical protein JWP02_2891, partial [Acidimicrobiales bacterium]|nr:hypothetical protein [Acidimicrobiales bacterium]
MTGTGAVPGRMTVPRIGGELAAGIVL